jgi:Carboxypeptidase regulatory-like domain/TonB-dependent Receptor Plug Domain
MNNYFKFAVTWLLLCMALTVTTFTSFAQATTGTITGTVTDQTGAIMAGAMITVRNTDTNITRTAQTGDLGRYSFPALPIGNYEVTIEQAGFGKVVRGPVVLTLSQTAVVDAELKAAGVNTEIVTIAEDAPIINTANAEVGVRFDDQRLANLPTQGMGNLSGGGFRDVFSFGLSVPGVSQINQGNTGFSSGTDYSVNGARLRSNNFTLDGQDVNEPGVSGVSMKWNNPDAIQEFRMITNQFSAEYGRASGSVVAVATKSGTNTFHGTASWYHNSNPLNSLSNVDKAAGLTKAPWRIENQFGGTLGGPIVRDKTFFFGSLQRWTDRQLGSGSTISSAPMEAGRTILQANGGSRVTTQALLSHLPAAQSAQTGTVRYCFNPTPWTGTSAPPAVTAAAGGFICAFPSAPADPVAGWTVNAIPVGTLTSSNTITTNTWQWSGRGDHTFNSRHSLSSRYMYHTQLLEGDGQATPKGLANVGPTGSQAATIGLTSTLSSTLLNELRGNFSRFITATNPQDPSSLTIPSIEVADLGLNGFNAVGTRTAIGYGVNLPQSRRNNIYQVVDNMTWIHGGHSTKFGIDFRRTQISSNFNTNVRGQLRYSTLTNLVADFADLTAQISKPLPGGQLLIDYNWDDWYFFVQDDWKVTPNFTLNLGLRYELPGQAVESLYPLNDQIVAANSNNSLFRYDSRPAPDRNNLMPRFGFNWHLGDTGLLKKMVVRGGYTRSFDYIFLNMALNITSAFPFTAAFSNPGTPNSMANLAGQTLSLANAPLLNQTVVAPDFRAPYADQYSLEIQRELSTNTVFHIGYVGTKGTSLFQSQEANPITRCGTATCTRVDPTRGVIRQRANTGSSIYHSLQTGLDRRLTRGLSGGVNYTWSSFIDNGSEVFNASTAEVATPQDPFNRNAGERARSTYDRPHRLTGNVVYELPFMRNQAGVAGRLAGGWQIGTIMTFQSGSPFTVLNGSDPGRVLLGSLVGNAIRPNFAPGVDVDALRKMTLPEIRAQILAAGTPDIFFRSAATNGGPTVTNPTGNVPRNFLRSDGLVSIDMNIAKNIKVAEGRSLQFRADFFNLPNHRNFGIPNASANATAFNFLNEAATDGGNRRIFFALRYTF